MSRSAIEQADAIVGIDWRKLGISPCHDTKNTYRRGAYFDWMAKNERSCVAILYSVTLEEMAEHVVAIQAERDGKHKGERQMETIIDQADSIVGINPDATGWSGDAIRCASPCRQSQRSTSSAGHGAVGTSRWG